MTWEAATPGDLTMRSIYARRGDFNSLARVVKSTPTLTGDGDVTFTSAACWASPGEPDVTTSLPADTPLFRLVCTCNGMSFIANRWVFTGQCSCLHHPLPKED
jgi:hypothetical protein